MPGSKHKVLILGGGVAGLTAAYHLSRTPELRAQYDVEVASLGWRLGGKLASGRDTTPPYASHEHGLHVWFGFYDNAFATLREIYARWNKPASCPFRTWQAVLEPQSFTPIGGKVDGEENLWMLRWPTNPGTPGEGGMRLTAWESFVQFLNLFEIVIENGLRALGQRPDEASFTEELLRNLGLDLRVVSGRAALHLLKGARERARGLLDDDLERDARRDLAALITLLIKGFQLAITPLVLPLTKSNVDAHDLLSLIEVGCAFARGILNPDYGIVDDGNLDRIDHLEFRRWLKDNGCDRDVTDGWRGLKALYDTTFQYVDGDTGRPDFAAGTAARVVLRIVTQYKGAVIWLFNAGVGEAVIAPLYEVLVDQGVRFRFFTEATDLKLSADNQRIAEVTLQQQVETADGTPYRPLFDVDGFRCWPTEPFWDQLKDGASLKAQGVDFESPWGVKPTPIEHRLRADTEFDTVVLATALGAFKRLNDVDRSMVDDLMVFDEGWQRMCETTGVAPTVGLQLWMKPDRAGLGWDHPQPAAVGIPYPNAVWADMTQVLDVEMWPDADQPGSLHYLCGTLGTDLYRRPRADASTPADAFALADAQSQHQLDTTMDTLWPKAVVPGTARLDPALVADRYLRANVAPTECCETTPTGSTQWKMAADRSGFQNLVLAGAWVRTGINASCVEAAVMSGMQASRAICRSPEHVVGEHFFHRFPNDRPGQGRLPKLISRYGHGEQAVPPPGLVNGAKTSCFFVPAKNRNMQATVDAYLNKPAAGAVTYTVLGDRALLTFLDGAGLTSTAQVMGSIPDREMAFWIPLLQHKRGHLLPELVFWMPYVIVDQSIACITGREIWGFLKEVGSCAFPGDVGGDGSFRGNAMTFLRFATDEVGEVRTLVRVHHPSGTAGQAEGGIATTIDDAINLMGGEALDGVMLRRLFEVNVPLVNLKQFPDARRPDRACYQALIMGSCRVEKLHGVTLLQPGQLLDVLPCASHEIVEDLGLPSATNIPLGLGIRVDMDFSIQLGDEIWRA